MNRDPKPFHFLQTELTTPTLLGAVTTGNIWQFGVLHRTSRQIEQGLNLYRVTEDIEVVVRILLAALIGGDRFPN